MQQTKDQGRGHRGARQTGVKERGRRDRPPSRRRPASPEEARTSTGSPAPREIVTNVTVSPACGQSGAASREQFAGLAAMDRFDSQLGFSAPQPPSGTLDRSFATQASGPAGPLPAGPLFFAKITQTATALKHWAVPAI